MKSTIDKHISQLLFDHECVIVPGFGAFLIREYSAEINAATHMLRPSSKRVAFNASIKDNDGLLANFISQEENVNYIQAVDSVAISVRGWHRMLRSGKKVNLPGIGRLYMDNEEKLQFNPAIEINYDRYSYGLNIFRTPAIQREMEITQVIHEAIELHSPAADPIEKKRRILPVFFKAATVAAFLGLSITAGFYFTDTSQNITNLAGFSPWSFGTSSKPVVIESPKTKKDAFVDSDANKDSEKEVAAKKDLQINSSIETKEVPFVNSTKPANKIGPKNNNTSTQLSSFHIIVGSFKNSVNATTYVKQLVAMGYDAYVAGGSNNYSRVAIGNFKSSIEAKNNLTSIKKDLNPSAWVYHN